MTISIEELIRLFPLMIIIFFPDYSAVVRLFGRRSEFNKSEISKTKYLKKKKRQNRVRFFVRLHFLIRPLSLSFPSPVFFYIFRFFLYFFRSASECLPSFNEPSPVGAFLWVPRIEYHNLSSGLFFYYSLWFSLDFLVKTKTKRSLWRVFLHLIGLTYRLGLGLANFFSYLMN